MENEKFVIYVKGETFPINIDITGPRIIFSGSGFDIIFPIDNPNQYERNSFKAGHPTKIGFAPFKRLGALIIDFKEGFAFDVPFDAGIEKPESIPSFENIDKSTRIAINIIGIDTANENKVFGIRYITLSPRVTQYFIQQISKQKSSPIDLHAYGNLINEMYTRYPDVKSIAKIALAFDKAGE
jgi:hypothetical protein